MSGAAVASYGPELLLRARDRLGESPVWDDRSGLLHRVDAVAGRVLSTLLATGQERTCDLGRHVGCVVLREDGPGLLVAAGDGFCALDVDTGEVTLLAQSHGHDDGIVFNDGACDPAGRFVAGTMRRDAGPGGGRLHRFAPPDGDVVLLEGAGIGNGLCWDEAGTTLLWVDTLLGGVLRLGYDPAAGVVTSRELAFDLSRFPGRPDGMAADAEGCVWVAFWRGGAVRRFDRAGRLLAEVLLPVSRTTSVCFAGRELQDLVVTTARQSVRSTATEVEPLAGSVFQVRVDVPGVAPARWRADA